MITSIRDTYALALAAALAACRQVPEPRSEGAKVANEVDGVATGVSTSDARFVINIAGFGGPESVRYDAEQDVFFVSNMTGYGSGKDGNGYISRVSAADPHAATVFIQGGVNGAALDAPKGMALHGDTLWVADIDVLRGFDRHTGAPLATVDFRPQHAVLLNDVAVGPDGTIRVTDTGILMNKYGVPHTGPDRIFAVGPSATVSVVAEGPQLRQPNGITWDAARERWFVVSFDAFVGEIAAMPATGANRQVIRRGTGRLDGVEVLPNGAILFTNWADSSLHILEGGHDRQLVRQVPEPADIGLDTRRNRVAIPLSSLGRVQLWDLGEESDSRRPATVAARR
jgi:SMP-30/Gluconolactonase/LRE-like region